MPENRWTDEEPSQPMKRRHPQGSRTRAPRDQQETERVSCEDSRIEPADSGSPPRNQNEAIFASEYHARAILNQTLDAIVVFDAESRLTFANDAARRLARLDPAVTNLDLGSGVWGKRYTSEGRPIAREDTWLVRALRGETTLAREVHMVRADGTHYDILVNGSPLRDVDGRIIGAVGTFDDITQRKEAERTLARSARQRERMTQAAARVMAQSDLLGLRKAVVEAALELTDARVGGIASRNAQDEFLVEFVSRKTGPTPRPLGEPFLVRPDGICLKIMNAASSLRMGDGELHAQSSRWDLPVPRANLHGLLGARLVDSLGRPCGLILVGDKQDGPEFSEDDEALLQQFAAIASLALQHIESRNAAEAANRAKSQFLAHMSHELRTPMTAIVGMTDLALEQDLTPAVRDYLETARRSADLLLELLNETLDFSRIESGRVELEQVPFSLPLAVQQVIQTLEVRAREKGLQLLCQLPEQLPDALVGDSLRLRQVLMNLVGNAIKFTRVGTVAVRVTLQQQSADASFFTFSVADTGIGIAPEDQLRIFVPFAQADASTTRQFGGTGLGLPISQKLVSLMGGQIRLESQPGQGSTFSFNLTFTHGQKPAEVANSDTALQPMLRPARTLHVLLAEDTPANQKLVSHLLARRGHAVQLADNGQEALELVRRHDFDVVLMDVQMPVLDGFRTTQAIRNLPNPRKAAVPIVAMTAYALRGDLERCLAAGMNTYLSKPLDVEALVATVEQLAAGNSRPLPTAPTPRPSPPLASAQPSGGPADPLQAKPQASVPVLNLDAAIRQCFGNYMMFRKMVDCLFEEAQPLLNQMRAALDQANTTELRNANHRLKGTVVYLCAASVEQAIDRVDAISRSGDLSSGRAALEELQKQLDVLLAALTPHRMPHPNAQEPRKPPSGSQHPKSSQARQDA